MIIYSHSALKSSKRPAVIVSLFHCSAVLLLLCIDYDENIHKICHLVSFLIVEKGSEPAD